MTRRACPLVLCLAACAVSSATAPAPAPDAGPSDGVRYLTDAAYRRAELEASLVNPKDGYAVLRLENYGRAWEALPVWNPRTQPVTTADLGPAVAADRPLGAGARALSIDAAARSGDPDALLELGRQAFSSYPVQLLSGASAALASLDAARRYGFLAAPDGTVGGLVSAEMADGSSRVAMTCATCHAVRSHAGVTVGAPNGALDLGLLGVEAGRVPPALAARLRAWGPGRLDVSSNDGSEPVRISDLRPVRFLGYLQHDATVQQRSIASLAIRVETLILTSQEAALRPPREVALGLALAVWALADELPPATPQEGEGAQGLAVIGRACAPCHEPPGFTGPPVPLAVVGTDPALGLSPERGTGFYRAPSLRGVASRGALLHDGSAPTLAVFFDPERTSASYGKGRIPGPVVGHRFNLDLPADERAAVLAYLGRL